MLILDISKLHRHAFSYPWVKPDMLYVGYIQLLPLSVLVH